MNNNFRGIIAVVIATLFFAFQDTFTKQLTVSLPVWQITSIRFFFFSLFALIYASNTIGIKAGFKSHNQPLQIFRGILIVTEITLFAFTIGFLGLAEMHAIFACFPLIVTALSSRFLGENVGWRRWLAVSIGFIGTLIILKPGNGVIDPYALLALLCALMLSIYTVLTRKLALKDQFETSLLYFGITGFIFSLLFIPLVWQSVTSIQWLYLVLLSGSAIVGHYCLIKALQLAPAAILQPFNYLILAWAMALGYLIFDEVLDAITLFGMAIVVCSGLFIARREYNLSKSN